MDSRTKNIIKALEKNPDLDFVAGPGSGKGVTPVYRGRNIESKYVAPRK